MAQAPNPNMTAAARKPLEFLQEIPAAFAVAGNQPRPVPVELFDKYVELLRDTWMWLGYVETEEKRQEREEWERNNPNPPAVEGGRRVQP